MGSRNTTYAVASLSVPLLWGIGSFSVQYRPSTLYLYHLVDRAFLDCVRIDHIASTDSGTISIFLWKPMLRIPGGLVGPDIMAPTTRQSMQPTRYMLYGLLYHHGVSASGGHYTVDVLHLNGNSKGSGEAWLHIDNEIVSAVQHEDVFGTFDDKRADNRCP